MKYLVMTIRGPSFDPDAVPAGEQPKWPPITANDYLQERLREIKLV